jgi:multidrug resistance efflux pump
MPVPQGAGSSGKLAWFLVGLLSLAVPWLLWRESQLVARFNQILAEGGADGEWSPENADAAAAGDSTAGASASDAAGPDGPTAKGAAPGGAAPGGAAPGGAAAGGAAAGGAALGGAASGGSPSVRVASVGEIALESKGYVIPAHQILVSPQVGGRLLRLFVEEGMRIKKDDLLGEIESTEFTADYARATATLELNRARLKELEAGNRPEEIDQARADLAEAEAQLAQLDAEYVRAKTLINSNVITKQDFEVIESRFQALQRRIQRLKLAVKLAEDGPRIERVESARAEVKQAEADVAKAKWRLDNCRILAPISGTVLKKNAEEGNIVNPVAFNGSFSICDVADLSDLEVSLDIQERDVSRVFKGQVCRIRADAYPDRVYAGTVSRLMPIADRAKGAVPVRVKLTVPADEEGVYLKPEMGAVVAFLNPARGSTAQAMKTAKPASAAAVKKGGPQ